MIDKKFAGQCLAKNKVPVPIPRGEEEDWSAHDALSVDERFAVAEDASGSSHRLKPHFCDFGQYGKRQRKIDDPAAQCVANVERWARAPAHKSDEIRPSNESEQPTARRRR